MLGIDRRPANNLLCGLGNSGRIYTLDEFTGAASFVSRISGATLNGTNFGIDFDPTVDRLRVVSDRFGRFTLPVTTGQNLRI
ncbi:MAG: DUF4394 domain-containing protein, partial [Rubrivivax sp.]|nr:DUF4394 domain-containing protein [Rubrivivax sp.]